MASAFDQRVVQVSIDFEGNLQTFEGLSIYATGQKFDSALFNTARITIFNLTKDQRNYILTRTSPINLSRKNIRVMLDVGRESYGTFRLFDGQIFKSQQTQPPDIGIILESVTSSYLIGTIVSQTESSIAQLSVIAKKVADNNGKVLDFQATDKQIENFCYNGAVAYQIRDLNEVGGIIASVDNDILFVRDSDKPLAGSPKLVSAETGMVGIPMLTDSGILVKCLIEKNIRPGELIEVKSEVLPAVNGQYYVQQIFFELANREPPFWYNIQAIAEPFYKGTVGTL